MKRPRITIGNLALIVLVAGIGFAAISSSSAAWAGAMLSITFFVMTCSVLGAIFERDMHRVYWIGFATLGWTYLVLSYAPWLDGTIGTHLVGRNILVQLKEALQPAAPGPGGFQSVPAAIPAATTTAGGFGGPMRSWNSMNVARIGVSIEALLWGFLGGWVACSFASGRERRSHRQSVAPTPPPEPGARSRATE